QRCRTPWRAGDPALNHLWDRLLGTMISTPRYYDQYTVEGTTPATGVILPKDRRKLGERPGWGDSVNSRENPVHPPFIPPCPGPRRQTGVCRGGSVRLHARPTSEGSCCKSTPPRWELEPSWRRRRGDYSKPAWGWDRFMETRQTARMPSI